MESITAQIRSLVAKSSPAERLKMLASLRTLCSEINLSPSLRSMETFTTDTAIGVMGVMNKLKIFDILAETDNPKTTTELSERTGADVEFLSRLLRYLAASSIVEETGEQTWAANDTTRELVQSSFPRQTQLMLWFGGPLLNLPKWAEKNGFKSPTLPNNCPWTEACNTDLTLFQHLSANPKEATEFNWCMESTSWFGSNIFEIYPMKEQAVELAADRVILVDVGGGNGHCTENARAHIFGAHGNEGHKSRFISQDLGCQIQTVKDAGIDKQRPFITYQEQNFFEPQKVQNAKFYYFRHILHDHPDVSCQKIFG
ncbi:hypothetical protein KEM56_001531 [Ascosphaera pollenicola]|nr:hypothetical protein KEM56_001531 [Ascosphaera pollenicola]